MSDAALLAEVNDFRQESTAAWQDIIAEAKTDMQFVSGNPWDPQDKKKREHAGRPCLTLDELGQYSNQVINDLRANPLGMKFSPRGLGATAKGAEFYQNKAREIEYRSRAQVAYITAAENMLHQSVGWVRVNTKYRDKSFDQDIWIEPVFNPLQILPDPNSVWPDSRDMTRLLYVETRAIADFKREFRGAKVVNFGTDAKQKASAWLREGQVDVGEFWVKRPKTRTLLQLSPRGKTQGPFVMAWADELEKRKKTPADLGLMVRRSEDREDFEVKQYLTNGLEVLEENPWVGKDIPFVSWFGKVLWVEGKRVILSQTRLARDPYMAYCFARTCEIEIIGFTTKNPVWAYEGQLTPMMMEEIAKSLHEPVAVLTAKHRLEGMAPDEVLPLPTRNQFNAELAGQAQFSEEMRRAIQASMAISPLPTEAQRTNQKSGKALAQIESSGQKGSFHFADHHKDGITRVGEICEDLIEKIHDTASDEWVHEEDGTAVQARINDPKDPNSFSTKGSYVVTVSAGQSFESGRDAANDFVNTLVQNLETIAQLCGPQVAAEVLSLSIKLKELGPIGTQIADLIEPPAYKSQDGKPVSPEVKSLQGRLQQVTGQLQQAMQERQMETAKIQGAIQIEQVKAQNSQQEIQQKLAADLTKITAQQNADAQKAAADRETKLAVAELAAKDDREKLFREERARLGLQEHAQRHEHAITDKKLLMDAQQREKDRKHALAAKKVKTVTTKRDPKTGALSADVTEQSVGDGSNEGSVS